jgi:Photosynthesis system II assembly factor YCF48
MPRDDRERNFENALARNLRANAPAKPQSDTSAAPASHSIPASDCPDAEILAAYHERLLAPEEMISRKAHIASCLRCQEILAHLEADAEIPLEADEHQVEPKSPIAVPQLQLVHAARASSSPAAREGIAKSDFHPDVPLRSSNRRWLVPGGVLAAALLLWVAIHESTPHPFQMAKNQQQPVPELPAPAPTPPADSAKEKSAEKELQVPSKNGSIAKTDALVPDRRALQEQETLRPSPQPRLAAPRGNFQPGASGALAGRAGAASRVQAQPPAHDKQLTRDAGPEPSPSGTPSAADSITNSPNQTAVTVAPSAPQQAKKEAAVRGVVAAPALQQSPTATAGAPSFREASNLATKLVQVSSPDGAVIWRLGRSGFLQLSEDSGAHWTFQKTSTVSDLLAGSAPSSKICWIAGRDGAILRTIDGGMHWLRVSSPTTEDVTNVFAVDSQQATVTTPTNQSYKTIDGGTTWTPLPNP